MPTLHATHRSRGSRNLWLAEEGGFELALAPVWQAYRLDDPEVEGAPMNTRSPSFLALSPMGAVPVLVDGDLVLTESLAINLYLARRYGGDLGPRDEAENAEMTQWALFAAASVEAPALAIQQAYGDGRDRTAEGKAAIEEAAGKLGRPLGALEAHLANRAWMVGGRFTVADVNTAEVVRYMQPHPALLNAHPATDAWLRRCQARPAFQRFWAEREAEPVRP